MMPTFIESPAVEAAGEDDEDIINEESVQARLMLWQYLQSLSPSLDATTLYFRELRNVPSLSHDEVIGLAMRIAQGDRRAWEQLIVANLPLVVSIARRYVGQEGLSLLDLAQEGAVGLIKAASRFDYRWNKHFSTYATWWIRASILNTIYAHTGTTTLPAYKALQLRRLFHHVSTYRRDVGGIPPEDHLADLLKLPVDEIRKLLALDQPSVSMDTHLLSETRGQQRETLADRIANRHAPNPEKIACYHALKQDISQFLAALPPDESEVLWLRYGLPGAGGEHTLKDIGKKQAGLTGEAIRRKQERILQRVREALGEEGPLGQAVRNLYDYWIW